MAKLATKELRRLLITLGLSMLAIIAILVLQPGSVKLGAIMHIRPHVDIERLTRAPLLVLVHLGTVFYALFVGPIQFLVPKATPIHRLLGWTWALAMLTTALTSLGIRGINHGNFSPIHVFSLWTLVGLPVAIWSARRGRIGAHLSMMISLYVGLIIAGLLAVAPGRLLWAVFFS